MFFKLPGGEVVMIDGGPASSVERVVSYLKRSGVSKIDLLIATHPHEDHIGGLISVLGSFPVSEVWDPGHNLGTATQKKFLEGVKKNRSKFEVVKPGRFCKMGDAEIRVVASANSAQNSDDANGSSIITHISWKGISFLLMGDAEHKGKIIDTYPRSDVLKIAHHGSRHGTTRPLLQKVKPRLAVVSCGADNPYGHPHKEALKLLEEFNVKLYSTVNGNIVLVSDGENYTVDYDNSEERGIMDIILDLFFKW